MKNITKALNGHCCISFSTVRCTGHSHYDFPRKIICNHLLVLVGIALILMAKDLTT